MSEGLDVIARLAAARRELGVIADALLRSKTSKRTEREDFGRRLNAVRASLLTVEMLADEARREEAVQ
jgi:hypothetical protein